MQQSQSHMHDDAEWVKVPNRFIHLKKGDQVIHKDPRSFEPSKKSVPLVENGVQQLDKDGDPAYFMQERPPACDLKNDYLSKGFILCQKDGSDFPKATKPKAKEGA